MGLIPDSTLSSLRSTSESAMRDTCVVTRGDAPTTLNPTTGDYEDGDVETVYSGPCRVRHSGAGRGLADTPGDQVTLRQYEAIVERNAADIREGDALTVTASDDALLVGRPLYVLSATWSAENLHRRLTLEDRQ